MKTIKNAVKDSPKEKTSKKVVDNKTKKLPLIMRLKNKLVDSKKLKDATTTTSHIFQELENKIDTLKADLNKTRSLLDAHINRQYAEIRVVEQDGEWGDYTGTFYCDSKDQEKVVIQKAKDHYEKYFREGVWHQNKTLGVFLRTRRSGKTLIKKYKTGDK
tara:strand:+ start:34 stop:513 length:480 start_codon:yes stop_codon:yes gene_type:complete